jgi:MPBQ/MSBQ methyltransferase
MERGAALQIDMGLPGSLVASARTEVAQVASGLFGAVTRKPNMLYSVVAGVLALLFVHINNVLWKPSRTYDREANSVGREYDAWTSEGILEYYWGEHIHLGYYNEEVRAKGYLFHKNFIEAKYDFIDEMAKWGGISDLKPAKVLDVGCGIGGTTRFLANKFGTDTQVSGITLSQVQVDRATALAKERGVTNADFQVMDALDMDFADNSFDVVWACESGEHMPDKKKYIEEMTRVLKPGGKIVVATWCQRDLNGVPFNPTERKMLDFLYAEWTHPYFISISDYAKLMEGTGALETIGTDDWAEETIPSWRHSIWAGVFDPWPVARRPHLWWKTLRDGITLERMHQAFGDGLMEYGMMKATKKAA